MKPKRIVILSNEDKGLYTFRGMLIKSLLASGNEVTLCVPKGNSDDLLRSLDAKIRYTEIDRRGTNPLKDLRLFRQYKSIIREEKPDFIITYTIKCNIYGGRAAYRAGVPYAMNVAGLGSAFQKDNLLKKLVVGLYKKPAEKAQCIFFENEENRKIFVEAIKCASDKTIVLPGAGVDLEEYPAAPMPPESPTTFLFMARIMKEKGFEELAEAFTLLKRDFGDDVRLNILGGMEENYADTVTRLEKENIVTYFGAQKDVKPYIAESHCCVLPSYHEGMSNTLLECAAMGRPLITTDIPGCREAVIDGQSGFLVPVRNAAALYEALKKFYQLSAEQKAEMGMAGRHRMEAVFDKRKVVEMTLKGVGL